MIFCLNFCMFPVDTEKEVEDNQLDHDYSDDQTILKRLSKLEKVRWKQNWINILFLINCLKFIFLITCANLDYWFQLFVRTRRRETETNELNNKVTMAVESINEVKGSIQHMVRQCFYNFIIIIWAKLCCNKVNEFCFRSRCEGNFTICETR